MLQSNKYILYIVNYLSFPTNFITRTAYFYQKLEYVTQIFTRLRGE